MRALLILPALTEAKGPFWRPIKYSLFPPLGLATLAAYFDRGDELRIIDEHVEADVDADSYAPDLVIIHVYITNAHRAYRLADSFRARGIFVALGGLHTTSLPDEAAAHADAIFLGPGEETFPRFLRDFRMDRNRVPRRYDSRGLPRSLKDLPPIRRDLIRRARYLVPNSIVVSRGCPHHCTFCYKDAFFQGGRSFYTQRIDHALAEMDRLPGRHLYFLDDHLFGDVRYARGLFDAMRGMNRVFQGAATVDSILKTDLPERAFDAGMRSVFVGFETLSAAALKGVGKRQNLERGEERRRDFEEVCRKLDRIGLSLNASFVFGLDGDDPGVFDRTVSWAVDQGITTCTFHVATPYPGTEFFRQMESEGRILHREWDLYDTRHAVHRPIGMTIQELEDGYWRAYQEFYSWMNIYRGSMNHSTLKASAKHFGYAASWRKLEPIWNVLIKSGSLGLARPLIESGLGFCQRQRARPDAAALAETCLETTDAVLASDRLRRTHRVGADGMMERTVHLEAADSMTHPGV